MTEIHLNLNNFTHSDQFLTLFPVGKEYEFTAKKVFRRKQKLTCTCNKQMVHNGYDYARKKGFGKVRIGKQRCQNCGAEHHEDKAFWKKLLTDWKQTITSLIMMLRDSSVAWATISKIMTYIIPCSKDKARYLFNEQIEQFQYPQDNFLIVNYDEQHPKKGRTQKFRLTLLNYRTRVPIAEGLFEDKNDDTIEAFLRQHLDVTKLLIIITDCDRRYPEIFKKIWGNKVIHQQCLLYLNKLIVQDFGRNTTLLGEYNNYLLLNIFYNREAELRFLERLLKKQERKKFADVKEKGEWLKGVKRKFYDFVKNLEHARRREKVNLVQRKLWKAKETFEALWQQRLLLPKNAQKRLRMIRKNWESFTAFYHVKGCPATNNAIENYYSTSLKTHRKKQFRTDKGLLNHMRLSALKRAEGFLQPKKTLLDLYGLISLIRS